MLPRETLMATPKPTSHASSRKCAPRNRFGPRRLPSAKPLDRCHRYKCMGLRSVVQPSGQYSGTCPAKGCTRRCHCHQPRTARRDPPHPHGEVPLVSEPRLRSARSISGTILYRAVDSHNSHLPRPQRQHVPGVRRSRQSRCPRRWRQRPPRLRLTRRHTHHHTTRIHPTRVVRYPFSSD